MKPQLPQEAGRLVRRQAGVITRAQAMAAGLTRGIQSILEHGYLYKVERPHALPEGTHQRRTLVAGCFRYEDIRYEEYGVIVELDGQQAHPEGERWRDTRRDNFSAARGLITLRYTYADIMERPCEVADEVARALASRGYTGGASRCSDSCTPGPGAVLARAG